MREDVEGNKTADVVDVDSKQLRRDLNSNQLIGKEVQIEEAKVSLLMMSETNILLKFRGTQHLKN